MDLPELGDGTDAAEQVRERARRLAPWLPDPHECPDCGTYCEATRAYDPRQAAFHPNGYAPAWECPDCGTAYRREE